MNSSDPFTAVLLGTAVGDALGLPSEGLSPAAIQRRWKGDWRMRLVFGYGMLSDDTEHTAMVALSLGRHPEDVEAFQRELANRLCWWFAMLPAATGLATARAIIKLWLGVSPEKSGVWSAGNGPAMRSAVIGVFFASDHEKRSAFVKACTRLTHTDPRAEVAAHAVAEAAALAATERAALDVPHLFNRLAGLSTDHEWMIIIHGLRSSWEAGASVREHATAMGLQKGVSGYAYHTVPLALYAWLRHPGDYRRALASALDCGGDTDTVGAIVGALVATTSGSGGIPSEWLEGITDWPLSVEMLRKIGRDLQASRRGETGRKPIPSCIPWALLRNICFLLIVLVHGFSRLLPRTK